MADREGYRRKLPWPILDSIPEKETKPRKHEIKVLRQDYTSKRISPKYM
jgi:hypothetical protein